MLYNPPSGETNPNAGYRGKNVAAGIQGSRIPPSAVEFTQREIVNAIVQAGLSPTNADLTQLWQAIQVAVSRGAAGGTALWHVGTAGGTPGALVVSSVTPAIAGDTDFLPCLIRMPAGIAANATLAIVGLGGPLQRGDGTPVQDGDAAAGEDVLVARHGGAWRLVGLGRAEAGGSSQTFVSQVLNVIAQNPSISPPRNAITITSPGPGMFTVPDLVTWIYVELVGGGGGGHGGGGKTWASGGGGAGGYSAKWIRVTPGQQIAYTVGAGGPGSDDTPETYAPNGGTTSFGPYLQATGGGGGRGGAGGCNGGASGVGSGGQVNYTGGNGGDGNNINGSVQAGAGGTSAFGGGGRTGTIGTDHAVIDGAAPGSGGGGIWGPGVVIGGNGAPGAIVIKY